MTKEVKVVEEAAKTTSFSKGGKIAIVAGATVLSAGVVYGVIRLVRHVKARRAAKGDQKPSSEE